MMAKPSSKRPFDRKAEAQRVLRVQAELLRELYLAGIPLTDPNGSPTVEQWSRWFEAMHEAHQWTSGEGDDLWPDWAGAAFGEVPSEGRRLALHAVDCGREQPFPPNPRDTGAGRPAEAHEGVGS